MFFKPFDRYEGFKDVVFIHNFYCLCHNHSFFYFMVIITITCYGKKGCGGQGSYIFTSGSTEQHSLLDPQ